MPSYFGSRWGADHWRGQHPPLPVREDPIELELVYSERFRRDLVELSPDLYVRAVGLVIGLPKRHLNDPHRIMPRDSRVCTIEDATGLVITYIIVLSLAELIVARLELRAPAV